MDQIQNRRIAAVKAADAINAIEGVPVSDYAKTLYSSAASDVYKRQNALCLLGKGRDHRSANEICAARFSQKAGGNSILQRLKCNLYSLFSGRMQTLHPSFYMSS